MAEEKVVKTMCRLCPPGCGIDVHVQDNKPVSVNWMKESVVGPLCIKAQAIPEWYQTGLKKRLLHPMRKVNGEWQQITWDQALDIIANKLKEDKKKYGPQSLAIYLGQVACFYDYGYYQTMFGLAHGTPCMYQMTMCYFSKVAAGELTYGAYSPPTLAGTKGVVVWAAHPIDSVPMAGAVILAMKGAKVPPVLFPEDATKNLPGKKEGFKLIVVDPRRTEFAKVADVHCQIRPGTDGALALGWLNVIINEKLYDPEFINKWSIGFDKLVELVKDYTPEKVAEITWVPADTIRQAARLYAATKPCTIFQGNCLDTADNGFQGCRAINSLIAVTANVAAQGGSILLSFPIIHKLAWKDFPKDKLPKVKAPGQAKYPLFHDIVGVPPFDDAIETMITDKPYPIKSLIIQAGNPISTWADTNRLRKALDRVEFKVVMDIQMTETAEYADIVLPATTPLEAQILYQYVGRPLIMMMREAVKAPGDCWPDWKLWIELAKRMGYEKYLPWKNIDEAQNAVLKHLGVTVDDLKAHPGGHFYAKREWKAYEREGFATSSGKIEFYSEKLKRFGYDPLPTYVEPAESPVSRPDVANQYPLVLITGLRSIAYLHSMQRDIPFLRGRDPEPRVELNTETAAKLGIADGDMVIIESLRGSCQMKAYLTPDIHPKVVSLPHGWGGLANQNYVTGGAFDPVVGVCSARAQLCRVRKSPV